MTKEVEKQLREIISSTSWIKTERDIDIYERAWQLLSRVDFFIFRRYIHGQRLKHGWFVKVLSEELQEFYRAYKRGEHPQMIVEVPPQHGKSQATVDFVAWIMGQDPDLRTILASFSDRLGRRANKAIQRMIRTNKYVAVFPETRLGSGKGDDRKISTSDTFFEVAGKLGSFRNTTVAGSITGESLDIGIIDDPIKGRKEANSENVRNKVWEWYTDDYGTRFQENSANLIVLTRWHLDDPAGRLLNTPEGKEVRRVRYPALATEDEKYRKEGEALFPEFKSKAFLLRQKSKMAEGSWASLYQQDPVIQGGNLFKYDWWNWWEHLPKLNYKFITVDTAQKVKQQNDYTVMQCWGVSKDETTGLTSIYLLDMLRGKFEAPELRKKAKEFYAKHKHKDIRDVRLRHMYIEDKSSGSSLIQDLKLEGYSIRAVQRNIDKVSRANDTCPYIEQGRVYLNKNIKDIKELTSESLAFPNGKHDDTLDPLMDAIDIAFIGNGSSAVAAMMA